MTLIIEEKAEVKKCKTFFLNTPDLIGWLMQLMSLKQTDLIWKVNGSLSLPPECSAAGANALIGRPMLLRCSA